MLRGSREYTRSMCGSSTGRRVLEFHDPGHRSDRVRLHQESLRSTCEVVGNVLNAGRCSAHITIGECRYRSDGAGQVPRIRRIRHKRAVGRSYDERRVARSLSLKSSLAGECAGSGTYDEISNEAAV